VRSSHFTFLTLPFSSSIYPSLPLTPSLPSRSLPLPPSLPFNSTSIFHYSPSRDALEGEFPRAISLFRTSQSYIVQARQSTPHVLAMAWFGQYAPGLNCLPHTVVHCIALSCSAVQHCRHFSLRLNDFQSISSWHASFEFKRHICYFSPDSTTYIPLYVAATILPKSWTCGAMHVRTAQHCLDSCGLQTVDLLSYSVGGDNLRRFNTKSSSSPLFLPPLSIVLPSFSSSPLSLPPFFLFLSSHCRNTRLTVHGGILLLLAITLLDSTPSPWPQRDL
jgi:hypothetical protein